MSDMKINKMNKQREVSILMQNTLSILLNISIGISEKNRWLSLKDKYMK